MASNNTDWQSYAAEATWQQQEAIYELTSAPKGPELKEINENSSSQREIGNQNTYINQVSTVKSDIMCNKIENQDERELLASHPKETVPYIRYCESTGTPIYHTWLSNMNENLDADETVDVDMYLRCKVYMSSFKCHKGEFCNKIHRYPKEDGILCRNFKDNKCTRSASDCWFSHKGEKVKAPLPENDAPYLVQPMGHLVAHLRSSNFSQGRVVKQQQQLDHRDPQSYHYKLQRWLQDQMNLECRDHQNSFHSFMKVIEKDIETQKRRYNPNIWQPHV